eukprot:gb/GECG01010317.1/.p1 GENE.gb/GECG01010317.1/~~gb/GECG01010317.1/.p1  ORF type:complete len:165 (+),score=11.60 gb/GECG01010317.1/:1-495(+)
MHHRVIYTAARLRPTTLLSLSLPRSFVTQSSRPRPIIFRQAQTFPKSPQTLFTTMEGTEPGPMQTQIEKKLQDKLSPVEQMEVVNESYKHNVPKGSESHFKVFIVSPAFEGQSLIQRHRMVNDILTEELQNGVHALSISAKTPEQYHKGAKMHETPQCRGGAGK